MLLFRILAPYQKRSSFFTSIGQAISQLYVSEHLLNVPKHLDKACFILAGIDEKGLIQAVETAVDMVENGDNGVPVPDYTDELVSTKVVKIIQSYTRVVDKMVWRKF